MVTVIIVSFIVALLSVIYCYIIYDSSRREQAGIEQTIKGEEDKVAELKEEQEKLKHRINQLELFWETGVNHLIEKANKELRDRNPSHLANLVNEFESTHLSQFNDLADRLLAPLQSKGLSCLSDHELTEAQNTPLLSSFLPPKGGIGVINQFDVINNLCRERGLIGIYIPKL